MCVVFFKKNVYERVRAHPWKSWQLPVTDPYWGLNKASLYLPNDGIPRRSRMQVLARIAMLRVCNLTGLGLPWLPRSGLKCYNFWEGLMSFCRRSNTCRNRSKKIQLFRRSMEGWNVQVASSSSNCEDAIVHVHYGGEVNNRSPYISIVH